MADSRTRVWFSLFVLAIFCVGLAVGLVLGRRMPRPPFDGPGMFMGARGAAPGPRPPRPGMLVERLDRELQLTDDQKTRVQAIFDAGVRASKRSSATWRPARPRSSASSRRRYDRC